MSIQTIIDRQYDIACNTANNIGLPKQKIYAMCNLRGGIGKTTLSFNLSYLGNDMLVIDTCPQGNLSVFMMRIIIQVSKQMLRICCCRI